MEHPKEILHFFSDRKDNVAELIKFLNETFPGIPLEQIGYKPGYANVEFFVKNEDTPKKTSS